MYGSGSGRGPRGGRGRRSRPMSHVTPYDDSQQILDFGNRSDDMMDALNWQLTRNMILESPRPERTGDGAQGGCTHPRCPVHSEPHSRRLRTGRGSPFRDHHWASEGEYDSCDGAGLRGADRGEYGMPAWIGRHVSEFADNTFGDDDYVPYHEGGFGGRGPEDRVHVHGLGGRFTGHDPRSPYGGRYGGYSRGGGLHPDPYLYPGGYEAFSDDDEGYHSYGSPRFRGNEEIDPEYFDTAIDDPEDIADIITRIMERGGGPGHEGAPPAPSAAIAGLAKKKADRTMLDGEESDCSICMETVKIGEVVTELPCKHWFHEACISHWLSTHDACPHCRESITSRTNNNSGSDGGVQLSSNIHTDGIFRRIGNPRSRVHSRTDSNVLRDGNHRLHVHPRPTTGPRSNAIIQGRAGNQSRSANSSGGHANSDNYRSLSLETDEEMAMRMRVVADRTRADADEALARRIESEWY